MAYSKQTWDDGAAGGTPLSAARLTAMEDGIEAAHQLYDDGVGSATEATVATSEATASTSMTNLTTVGPAVTVDIGPSGKALVILGALITSDDAAGGGAMGFAVSGASTVAASTSQCLEGRGLAGGEASKIHLVTGLTPGSNTFTAKYQRISVGTATFVRRVLAVVPL